MNKDERILKLIKKIDSGTISGEKAARIIDQIYNKYGETEILYEVNDRTDLAYYEELLSNAKIGIYNKQSLIRMAEINYKGKSGVDKTKACIIGSVIALTIIIIIVITAAGGES